MDKKTYQRIYNLVNSIDDVNHASVLFKEPKGVICSILNQKIVSKVKKNMHRLQNNSSHHMYLWKKGISITNLAQKNDVPATLMASIIIKEMGYSKKHVLNNLDTFPDRRLANEVRKALESDHFFSPKAHELQSKRGIMGENIIARWLCARELEFSTEEDLREMGHAKTPDFLLSRSIEIEGREISWIESKAIFGDIKEHAHYFKKQYQYYERDYGTGMVVYWYGYLDGIEQDGYLVKDHTFYCSGSPEISANIRKLLNFTIQW